MSVVGQKLSKWAPRATSAIPPIATEFSDELGGWKVDAATTRETTARLIVEHPTTILFGALLRAVRLRYVGDG
jgi:hypothetical protein